MKRVLPTYLTSTFICFLITVFAVQYSFATSLGVGDLAITSFNEDGDDEFSFVLLTDISGTTEVYFTDNGWDDDADGGGANPTWGNTSEETFKWSTTSTLTCGTEIQMINTSGTWTASNGTVTETGSFRFSD